MTASRVDWTTPRGRPDPVYGAGARTEERWLARGAGLAGVLFVAGYMLAAEPGEWRFWQYALAAVLTYDLAGGVVANGLNSAKRAHFGPAAERPEPRLAWLARRPVLFAAVHVQPFVAGVCFPGGSLWWGALWYAVTLAAVLVVRWVPLYLQRPVALAVCVGVVMVSALVAAPAGFWWLPAVLALKLVLAHAVQEEPYRPVTGEGGGR